jgi:ElaB/YqjD/DUF883 family membrane-anchored ribosome-binding protein
MPNHNRGNAPGPQGQGGGTRPANGGLTDTARDVGQRVQEGFSNAGQKLQDGYGAAGENVAHAYRRAEGLVARNPGSSVLVGFGVGFGLGVLLTALLSRREEPSWYDRYVPEKLRDLRLPDSIARHLPGR